jgi:hypothetical protein
LILPNIPLQQQALPDFKSSRELLHRQKAHHFQQIAAGKHRPCSSQKTIVGIPTLSRKNPRQCV